jgi:endonuclease/exonuclease/phosphatase family metal-dependent hydrolase
MPTKLRIATFNLENFDDKPIPQGPEFAERVALMRPQLNRLRADILCLQEVHGQQEGAVWGLRALESLLADTSYVGFKRVSTVQTDPAVTPEDIGLPIDLIPSPVTNGPSVRRERNLVMLTRFDVIEGRQIRHAFVSPPVYQPITAANPQNQPITWERPILYTRLSFPTLQEVHVITVHLKSKIPANIPGQKIRLPGENVDVWKTASGRAEGSFLSSMQRMGQAVEVRRLVDAIFDLNENAFIIVCGDFNADQSEVSLEAIRGDVEDTDNPQLARRVLVPCERTIPEPSRFSLYHRGKPNLLDHILISRPFLAHYRGTEIHNELLHDESIAFATDKKFPESDHAPMVAEFELP